MCEHRLDRMPFAIDDDVLDVVVLLRRRWTDRACRRLSAMTRACFVDELDSLNRVLLPTESR